MIMRIQEFEDFRDSARKWQFTAQFQVDKGTQASYVQAEMQELEQANPEQAPFRLADAVWALEGLLFCLERDNAPHEDKEQVRIKIASYSSAFRLHPRQFEAVSISNWSKLIETGEAPLSWEARELSRFRANPRFANVRREYLGDGYAVMRGDDHQDPDNIQYDKLLKPSTYIRANDIYKSLKNEGWNR